MTDLSTLRIFVCTAPIKMNFSFDRLMGLTQEPLSGHFHSSRTRRFDADRFP